MKLLCYGDSNTYGYDPRGPIPGRYDADHRWCDLLAYMTGWTVINEGENGRMDAMINFLQTGWPQVQLVLITPPPLDIPEFPEAEDKLNALIDAYQQLAKDRKISFINNHSWNLPLAYDGVHFTETGHQVFANLLRKELQK